MTMNTFVEPDLDFIAELTSGAGLNLKKCYQCATCSVVCSISHDENPFPRKEMMYASWGLKDRLLANPDIWLCYNCRDCSDLCPRDARPGEVLSSLRKISIRTYSKPAVFHSFFNDTKKLPWLFVVPALVILSVGLITGLLNLNPGENEIVFASFMPVSLIEIIFIPLSIFTVMVFFFGCRRFIGNMHEERSNSAGTGGGPIDFKLFLKILIGEFPAIVKHERFSGCLEKKERKISHMMVSFSFTGLAFVAGAFVFALYVLNSHAPYSQLNPIKILANICGVMLITGSLLMILNRRRLSGQGNEYFDWYLLGLILMLGITGMMSQLLRLGGIAWAAYSMYFVHLIFAFNLVISLPYTKLAHSVYRTLAMAYYFYDKAASQTPPR